jgi:hypothetical protein
MQNGIEGRFFVIEKAIDGDGFGVSSAGGAVR